MKQPHERGELGAWLVEQRTRLGEERGKRLTQQAVVDELVAGGYSIDASYYRALESGAKKSAGREIREALGRYFGRTPPSPSGRTPIETDLGRLVQAIEGQTEAINRLVARLDEAPDPEAWKPLAKLAARLVTAPDIGDDEEPGASRTDEAPPAEVEPQPAGKR